MQKIINFARELLLAALSIRKVERPLLFLLYTVLIWVGYWLMTYVAFYSMPVFEQANINLLYFAFIITVMGGIGFAMPVPGGMGPYHAAVIFTFVAFSFPTAALAESLGQTFAIVLHSAQLVMMIVVGALGYFYLWLQTPRDSSLEAEEPALAPSGDTPLPQQI